MGLLITNAGSVDDLGLLLAMLSTADASIDDLITSNVQKYILIESMVNLVHTGKIFPRSYLYRMLCYLYSHRIITRGQDDNCSKMTEQYRKPTFCPPTRAGYLMRILVELGNYYHILGACNQQLIYAIMFNYLSI